MRILQLYILRLHLVPWLLGLGVVTFILEMDVIFDYLDLVVNRGVALSIVAQLFLLSLGYIVALSVPCAVLVAVLMTFGRLSQDNEITALRAVGVNLGRLLVGPLLAAGAITYGLTLFNNHVLPNSNHAFANLLIDIGRMRPTVKLQEGVFITDFPGYNLLVQKVNGRTNEMRGVTLYQFNPDGPPTTIVADHGFLSYTPDGQTAVLELRDGEIHEVPPAEDRAAGSSKYRRLVFKTHVIHIAEAGGILERSARDSRSDRELSASSLAGERDQMVRQYEEARDQRYKRFIQVGVSEQLANKLTLGHFTLSEQLRILWGRLTGKGDEIGAQLGGAIGTEVQLWMQEREALLKRVAGLSVEIHKKFSLPVASIVFVLVGAPLGMRVRRAGPSVAFISIAFFLFYYLCLVGGEELANRLLLPPWLSMWLPNLLLGTFGLVWTFRTCEIGSSMFRRPLRAAA